MKSLLGICILIFAVNALAWSQNTGRNAVERASNRKQISEGKKNLERDIQELAEFNKLYNAYELGLFKRDTTVVNTKAALMNTAMQRELQQSKIKADKAKRELRSSRSESRSSRREVQQGQQQAPTSDNRDDLKNDKYDYVDDKVDVMDDQMDLQILLKHIELKNSLIQKVNSTNIGFDDDASIKNTIAINNSYRQFLQLMAHDVELTKAEIQEDRNEATEDRKETRDDIKETNEPSPTRRRK